MTALGSRNAFGSTERQTCVTGTCFATFDGASPRDNEVRHCNRAGPDGGHAHQWDGQAWQVVSGKMQHDHS